MDIIIDNIVNDWGKYKSFIQENHLHLLTKEDHFGIGISTLSDAIAYTVVRVSPEHSQATIIALLVEQRYRGIGIERILLTTVERKLKEKNYRFLTYDCVVQEGEKPEREFLQQSEGWGEGRALSTVFIASIYECMNAKWMGVVKIPNHFQIFTWDTLTETEKIYIQEGKDSWYPAKLSPWHEEHLVDRHLSIGVRYKGEVVGWSLVQRAAKNMVLFKSLFVRDQYSKLGRGALVLAESIKVVSTVNEIQFGMFVVENDNKEMLDLTKRHLLPYVIRKKHLVSFRKSLSYNT